MEDQDYGSFMRSTLDELFFRIQEHIDDRHLEIMQELRRASLQPSFRASVPQTQIPNLPHTEGYVNGKSGMLEIQHQPTPRETPRETPRKTPRIDPIVSQQEQLGADNIKQESPIANLQVDNYQAVDEYLHHFKLADILVDRNSMLVEAVPLDPHERDHHDDDDKDDTTLYAKIIEYDSKIYCSRMMLDPNSKRRFTWDLISVLWIGYDTIFLPIQIAFPDFPSGPMRLLDLAGTIFWTIDIFATFQTGYYSGDGALVMSHFKIARRYLKTWFLPELTIVFCDWLAVGFDSAQQGGQETDMLEGLSMARLYRILRLVRILRLARARKMHQFLLALQDCINSEALNTIVSILQSLLIILTMSHFLACLFFAIGLFEPKGYTSWVYVYSMRDYDVLYQYLTSLHYAICQFTPAGMHVQPQNVPERIFGIVLVLFGMIIFSTFVSNVTSQMTHLRSIKAYRSRQCWLLRRYLAEQRIPANLSFRLRRYAVFVISSQMARVQQKDVSILSLLSAPLQVELLTALYKPRLEVHPLFGSLRNDSLEIIRMICRKAIHQEIMSGGDIIFRSSEMAHAMIFNMKGELTFRHKSHVELDDIVESGFWCCEAALWTQWKHCGSMRAAVETDFFRVDDKKFQEVLLMFPQLENEWMSYATNFIHKLNMSELTDVIKSVRYPFLNYGKAG